MERTLPAVMYNSGVYHGAGPGFNMQPHKIDIDQDDLMEVYYSEIRRPGYVLQLGSRQHNASVKAEAALSATIKEREAHRHGTVDAKRPRH